jgi:hypothetical protein
MKHSSFLTAAVLFGVLSLFTSCRYKDLCYDHNHDTTPNLVLRLELNLDLDIEIDVDIQDENHTQIKIPSYMVVCFYDTLSGSLKYMEYVESYGGPLHVNPGTYDMVVYSFDTEWTQVRGENHIDSLEAFTSDITATKAPQFALFPRKDTTETAPGPIIYTPDHLLVTNKRVEIPPYSIEEQVITVTATAATIAETYSFEVQNIEGIEYVSSVEAFITNQARANYFGREELCTDPATIYFPMEVNRTGNSIKSTFNTFGKLPGEIRSYLNILMIDSEGKAHTRVTDVTEQFGDSLHTIVLKDTIVIPAPSAGGGGIAPTVEEWEEVNRDVPIG